MNATFTGLLDNHFQTIKSTDENSKGANEVLLKTVKLLIGKLVDNIDHSGEILSRYDKMEIRQLFATFGSVAQAACDFFRGAKNYLDPVALNGEIGRKLEAVTVEITEVNGLMESIEKNSAELLEKEEELESMSDEYKKKVARVSDLKKIQETITPEVLEKLENEVANLEEFIKINQKIKSDLNDKIDEYKTLKESLSNTIVKANSEKKAIEENITETINERIGTMKEICEGQSMDLNRLVEEIENYRNKYSQLEERLSEIKAIYNEYELHLGENSEICKELEKHGVLSTDNLADEIKRLETTVGSELARYDILLKNLLVMQKQIKEELINKANFR